MIYYDVRNSHAQDKKMFPYKLLPSGSVDYIAHLRSELLVL